MAEHGKHHHQRDDASLFKERSLRQIEMKRRLGRWLKGAVVVLAVIMGLLVVAAYLFG